MPVSIDATERQPLIHNHYSPFQRHEHDSHASPCRAARRQTRRLLTSKYGHYSILLLVSLDVSCIFADFILSLYVCEHTCKEHASSTPAAISHAYALSSTSGASDSDLRRIATAQDVLGIVSLVFSCLFLLELLASIAAFGPAYFRSKFHCFDAAIIVAGFVVDVCLKGVLEEIGSIVVVLRLWRVVKIIEELSAGAEEQMEEMNERVEIAEKERDEAVRQLESVRKRVEGISGNGNRDADGSS